MVSVTLKFNGRIFSIMSISSSTSTPFQPQTTVLAQSEPAPEREFRVVKGGSPYMKDVRQIFESILVPLYGSQEKAIQQIADSTDRACHLLFENEQPVGIIVYKTVLSDEFKDDGVAKSIEIKSLFVVNSKNNSGRGIGSLLMNKVIQEARKLNLGHQSIHVTVSETKKESLMFFLNKDFRIVKLWNGRYFPGVKEYLLSRPENPEVSSITKPDALAQKINALNIAQLSVPTSGPSAPNVIHTIENAHWGRVHGMKLLADGSFITGSEDGSLRKWGVDGKLQKIVRDVEPMGFDEQDWVTALGVVNDEYWLSGARNGQVSLWTTAGKFVKQLVNVTHPGNGHISKRFNARRVNCFATGNKNKGSFFVGFPTIFEEVSLIENRTLSVTKASNNDWVYCIHPLDNKRLLAVTAGYLNLWNRAREEDEWQRGVAYIREPKVPKTDHGEKNRHHISCLISLESSPNHFAAGIFDGSVKVVDIAQNRLVSHFQESNTKVWSIENISTDVFASAGDDGILRYWDVRQSKSVHSTPPPVAGSLSTLLRLTPHTLVAGFTPTKEVNEHIKASKLLFFDIRK